ncbi:MAG TPA: SDR family oxidoreductase [Dongiaceae bacterium]|nr:SDR family oxidoreductase [Dongiaceae bacterium]
MSGARLDGQSAIVTGGAGGIGLATAKALARLGAAVTVVDVDADRARAAAAAVAADSPAGGALPAALALDVTRAGDMETMAAEVLAARGRIDILVAAAGILRGEAGRPQMLHETAADAWDRVIDINLTGTYFANRAVLPAMLKAKSGNIVNVSSTSGKKGLAYDAAYCASKFGVIGLSESLAEEARPHGVRVQVVLPEVVDTPMLAQNGPLFRPKEMLPAERVAAFITHLVTLPQGMVLVNPVLGVFRAGRKAGAGA